MLEDTDGGTHEVRDQIRCCLDIENVRVAQLLALQLGKNVGKIPVKSGRLVRVITIAKLAVERLADDEVGARAFARTGRGS